MTARYLAPLFLLAIACDSPGSGGRGGVFPTSVGDTVGGDTSIGGDTAVTTDPTTTTTADTQDGADTFAPLDTNQPPDVVSTTCTELPFAGELELLTPDGSGGWSSPPGASLGIGGAAPDLAMILLESSATGTFSLAGQTPTSCTRCLTIVVDQGSGGTTYFATAGSIQVYSSSSSLIDFALTDVTFTEVEGMAVVPGGACLHLASVRLGGEGEVCEPACGGKVCGDDGCGGECGEGCSGGTTCNASGTQCVGGTTGCTTISPSGALEVIQPGAFMLDITSLGLGTGLADSLQLEFYVPDTGTFNLGTGANDNYSTCEQCIRIFEDTTETSARIFYQRSGTMAISAGSAVHDDPPSVSATLTNVELEEVTIADDGTFESTPVSGGKCYKISNRTLSSQ